MEASKVTVGSKTYDMNFLRGAKRSNLRRKLIIEYIQSKPSGHIINMSEFQYVGRFNSYAATYAFVQRMVKQGIIGRYAGSRTKTYSYGVNATVRTVKPHAEPAANTEVTAKTTPEPAREVTVPNLTAFICEMQTLGMKVSITIESAQ